MWDKFFYRQRMVEVWNEMVAAEIKAFKGLQDRCMDMDYVGLGIMVSTQAKGPGQEW